MGAHLRRTAIDHHGEERFGSSPADALDDRQPDARVPWPLTRAKAHPKPQVRATRVSRLLSILRCGCDSLENSLIVSMGLICVATRLTKCSRCRRTTVDS